MTRQEKARIKKIRKRIVFATGIIILFSIFGIGRKFFGKPSGYIVQAKGSNDILEYETPVIVDLNTNIEKMETQRKEAEFTKFREEIKRNKLEEQMEKDKHLKIAYLTFDDGPSTKSTPAILEILARENIKATFFVQGQNVRYYPEIFKRVHDEGHAIGHHSYSHNYKYLYSSTNNFMSDIYKTEKEMQNVLGPEFKTHLLRLPGGAFGAKKMHYVDVAASKGYINYNWNALNGDAEGNGFSSQHLLNRLKNTVGGQKKVIILMHDTNAKGSTVDYLPSAIKYLRDQGYEFRTLE